MSLRLALASIALVAFHGICAAQTAAFDGAWKVTLTCPPHNEDDEAKGYTHRFPAVVEASQIRGEHGKAGEPGWHLLTGRIAADGSATLRLEGIVNNEKYAINNAQRGKAYRYRVRAQFEATQGSGERMTGRECRFTFAR